MDLFSVLLAGIAAWIFGAVWYSIFAKPWMADSRVPLDDKGIPVNRTAPLPYILAIIAMIVVAGMMRHAFAMTGIDGLGKGIVAGLGIGAFFISPWIMINNGYSARPFRLTLIDGGYATFGCAIIGAVLVLF
ncbi:MAG: DUF1761 domain-containing protein [Silicimonas sp.]|jgi:hypothetical protein|nr:DUF1761 domain-containing protein [Silicimonas sp.]